MRIDTQMISKITRDLIKKDKTQVADKKLMHPLREWFFGVGVGIILITIISYFSINTYLKYDNIDALGTQPANTSLIYRELEVEAALNYLNERQALNLSTVPQKPSTSVILDTENDSSINISTDTEPSNTETDQTDSTSTPVLSD